MYYFYHINSLSYIEVQNGMSFGRNTGTKTFPDDGKMSGEHCRFYVIGDEIWVEDLNSKNRTILDRMEIMPQNKTEMMINSMLEVGLQRFILTDRNLSIQDINEIVNSQDGLQVAKLEGVKLIQERNERFSAEVEKFSESEAILTAQLIEKKVRISDAQKAIISLAKGIEAELKQLEVQKALILNSIIEKETGLQNEIGILTLDAKTLQKRITEMKEEIEMKKKKIKSK